MGRYLGPKCKLCRREGMKLYLKGEKCYTDKCPFEKRPYAPGQHGPYRRRIKLTDYGMRLREKQKLKRIYGVSENQFRKYFELAQKMMKRGQGFTQENLASLLERRLDNVVYRAGFASSRTQARQMIVHGHVLVDGQRVDIPSYLVEPGEVIEIHPKFRDNIFLKGNIEAAKNAKTPEWLSVDYDKLTAKVVRMPQLSDVEYQINYNFIIEFYSR